MGLVSSLAPTEIPAGPGDEMPYRYQNLSGVSYPVTSHEHSEGDKILEFHPYFNIQYNQDGRAVSSMHRAHFTLKKIPLSLFVLEVDCKSGLLTEGIGNLKISQDPTGNRTRNLPTGGVAFQPTTPPLAPYQCSQPRFRKIQFHCYFMWPLRTPRRMVAHIKVVKRKHVIISQILLNY